MSKTAEVYARLCLPMLGFYSHMYSKIKLTFSFVCVCVTYFSFSQTDFTCIIRQVMPAGAARSIVAFNFKHLYLQAGKNS